MECTGKEVWIDNPDSAITGIMISPEGSSITAYFWPECVPMVAAGGNHTVGFRDNGRMPRGRQFPWAVRCRSLEGYITQVAAGEEHTVGLKSDGYVSK